MLGNPLSALQGRLTRGAAAAALAFLCCSGALAQQTVWVDDGACPGPGNGSETNPYCRIQDAICTLKDSGGGTVLVKPGTYNEAIRMFLGVSVVSTDGPAVTTIDATGKACITATCTTSTTTPCSVVYYPAGSAGTTDRLEGFRLTGGKGIKQTCSGTCNNQIGGGITILNASPTITRNEIVGNTLNPVSTADTFLGGGIYMHAGTGSTSHPVITQNLIDGNVTDPPAGRSSAWTNGLGGGIYVGYNAAPHIEGNTIRLNRSGDVAKAFQIGGGGGISVYTLAAHDPPAVITRNLIQQNDAADWGGGVGAAFLYVEKVPSSAQIQNNLIERNDAEIGGGVFTEESVATIRNNTIVDNTAVDGAGVDLDTGTGGNQATLVNNLVTFNTASVAGGGLYVSASNPTVRENDLHGNTPTNVAGDKTDASYIGLDGNVNVNPTYISRVAATRNLRLLAGSPVIDDGDTSQARGADLDGGTRVQDGNGDGTAAVDMGAYEYSPDFDGDSVPDWSDPDDDNDGTLDEADCAARQRGVSSAPAAVGTSLHLGKIAGAERLRWNRSWQGHTYNVYRGTIDPAVGWSYATTCLATELIAPQLDDGALPAPGTAYYYLVSARNTCAESAAGHDGEGVEIRPPSCTTAGRETDGDTLPDLGDNCPAVANGDQADGDVDFVGNACDNCASLANADQANPDADARGSACDNCPSVANDDQQDGDADGVGSACDNCAGLPNADQANADLDAEGDACDVDDDDDAVLDAVDNCRVAANPDQTDSDLDGAGNACDPDDDNDSVADGSDCAPLDASAWSPPTEVAGLLLAKGTLTRLSWTAQTVGSRYDVAGQDLASLRAAGNMAGATCLANDVTSATWEDPSANPPAGQGRVYVLRAQNACGAGTYGSASSGAERLPTSGCP